MIVPAAPKRYQPPGYKRRTSRRSEEGAKNHKLYYSRRWRRASAAYLAENPICVECSKAGRMGKAVATDHIEPHKGDLRLFWDMRNWQGLCGHHHGIKSARE